MAVRVHTAKVKKGKWHEFFFGGRTCAQVDQLVTRIVKSEKPKREKRKS